MSDHLQTEAVVLIFILSQIFLISHHYFSLVLKHRKSMHFRNVLQFTHTLAVNVDQVSPGPVEVADFLFWLVIFFGLVLSLKLQIELSGIH